MPYNKASLEALGGLQHRLTDLSARGYPA